jgi:hypothetical protein
LPRRVFVVNLELDNLGYVGDQKDDRDHTVIDHKFCKRLTHRTDKSESMSIGDIARNVERGGESAQHGSNDKKASEVDLMKIFRIKKQVRNPQVLTKISADHRKQDDPTQHQDQVALKIVQ